MHTVEGKVAKGQKEQTEAAAETETETKTETVQERRDAENARVLMRETNRCAIKDVPVRFRTKDGRIKHLLIDSNVNWNADGYVPCVCVHVHTYPQPLNHSPIHSPSLTRSVTLSLSHTHSLFKSEHHRHDPLTRQHCLQKDSRWHAPSLRCMWTRYHTPV